MIALNPQQYLKSYAKKRQKLKIASFGLFSFNSFKKGFKITFSKTFGSFPLNDLKEKRWPVLNRFGEQL
jgi:hypothetical protein